MPEEITPHAHVIPQTGSAEWAPPIEDDNAIQSQQQQPHDWRWVFIGKDGLRAGWSILLFLIAAVAIDAAVFALLIHFHVLTRSSAVSKEVSLHTALTAEYAQFSGFALAAWLMAFLEKRRYAQFGLGSLLPRLQQFAVGLLAGFVILSALVGTLWASHLLVFDGRLLSTPAAIHWGVLWAIAFLGTGFFEEYLTRGYLQFTIARGLAGIAGALGMHDRSRQMLGFWAAAFFFSFLFGAGHLNNPGESRIGLLSAALIGLVFAWSLWRTGSLWWAIGLHASWDWAQSFVYGVADSGTTMQHHLLASHPVGTPLMSGGLTGPEGSIFVLAAIALIALLVALTLPSEPGSPSDPNYSPNRNLLLR